MIKILQIIPSLRKGGAERLVLDILKQLSKIDNFQVKLIIFRDEIKYDISEIKHNIFIIPSSAHLSLKKKWNINVPELQNFIVEFKPDFIHTHLFETELVSRFCNYPKARWFSHVHDNMVQFKNWSWSSISKSYLTNWYEKQILFNLYNKNGGTHFIAISKHTEYYINSVQSKYPVNLLHNAIDVKRFQKPECYNESIQNGRLSPIEGNHPVCRRNEGRSPLTINLINTGSFVPKKNQTFLLDIILELNKKDFQTSCVFLGDGLLKNGVENRAKELGISNQCNFLGNVENVEDYLWQSDVYVHTANYEPLGLVLLEAMAAGLPVVTFDGGGNRDLMINGKNGYLIEKQDSKEFANRILEVYQNKEISDFNAEFAKQYDIESYCEKLVEIYQS